MSNVFSDLLGRSVVFVSYTHPSHFLFSGQTTWADAHHNE
jgi:hypothetical protein